MLARAIAATAAFTLLASCAYRPDLSQPVDPIGDFRLGHLVVLANDTTMGPFSREASTVELETALSAALEERLRRYDGDGLYHIGVRIEAYVLAGELHRTGGDIERALAAFAARLRSFVTAKQRAALRFRSFFAPRTALALAVRNIAVRALSIPYLGTRLIGSLQDDLVLPNYLAKSS